jgi:hypothetical protein
VFEEFLVGVGDVVVGDGDRLDLRRQAFERREVGTPGICGAELVVEDSAGRMNMRLPIGAIPNRD